MQCNTCPEMNPGTSIRGIVNRTCLAPLLFANGPSHPTAPSSDLVESRAEIADEIVHVLEPD